MVYKKYVECRCIPHDLIDEINDVFDEYKKHSISGSTFKNITLDQIQLIEDSVEFFDEKDKDKIRTNLIFAIEHQQKGKTLEFINRYLRQCECPAEVKINWKDGFHSYENIKKMLQDMM